MPAGSTRTSRFSASRVNVRAGGTPAPPDWVRLPSRSSAPAGTAHRLQTGATELEHDGSHARQGGEQLTGCNPVPQVGAPYETAPQARLADWCDKRARVANRRHKRALQTGATERPRQNSAACWADVFYVAGSVKGWVGRWGHSSIRVSHAVSSLRLRAPFSYAATTNSS